MAIKFLSSENIAGDIDVTLSKNGITYLAVTNTNTGVSANARVQVVGESSQLDLVATSAGYTGVSGWADSGIISTDSGASGGLKLNSQAGGIQLQSGTTSYVTMSASGTVGIGTDSPTARLDVLTNSVTGDNNIDRHVRFRADNGEQRFNFFVGRSGNSANLSIYNSSEGVGAFISSDNDSYFIGGNVGIGVSSIQPWARLEVAGTAGAQTAAKQALYVSSPSTTAGEGVGMRMSAASGTHEAVGIIGVVNNASGNAGSMTFHTYNLGSDIPERMRITSAGNVGIGVPFATAKLQIHNTNAGAAAVAAYLVNASISLNTETRLAFAAHTNDDIATGRYSYISTINTSGSNGQAMTFATNETGASAVERMRIASDGSVGIGVISPVKKLQVSDSATGLMTNLLLTNTHDTNGDTAGIAFSMTDNDLYNKAGIVFERTTTQGRGKLYLCNNNTGDSSNFTLADAAMEIDSLQNLRTYAKLGIRVDGDAIPWRGTAQIPAVINLAGNGAVFTRPDNTFLSQNFYYNASDIGAVIDAGQASMIQLTPGEIIFSGSTTGASSNATISVQERMRINSNGKVGIGTVNAANAELAIKSGSNCDLELYSESGGTAWQSYNRTTSSWGNIRLITGGGAAMLIDSTGNVGIGTTSPNFKLHIESTGADTLLRLQNTTTNRYPNLRFTAAGAEYDIGVGGTGTATGYVHNFYIYDITNSAPRFTLTQAGDIGIGTQTPTRKLQIDGGSTYPLSVDSTQRYLQEFKRGGVSEWWIAVDGGKFILHENGVTDQFDMSGGTGTFRGDVVAYGSPSDKRLKENIKPIESALDKVSKLQGVTFDWKKSDSILDIKQDIGFIAQDVQKVVPELVRENEDGMLSIRHQGVIPILVEAMKEQQKQIEELKKQIKQ